MTNIDIETKLKEAVEAAKALDAQLECQTTERADTENIATNLIVRFAASGPQASLCLTRLMDELSGKAKIGSLDVFGPPENQVVLFGTMEGKDFTVTVRL